MYVFLCRYPGENFRPLQDSRSLSVAVDDRGSIGDMSGAISLNAEKEKRAFFLGDSQSFARRTVRDRGLRGVRV